MLRPPGASANPFSREPAREYGQVNQKEEDGLRSRPGQDPTGAQYVFRGVHANGNVTLPGSRVLASELGEGFYAAFVAGCRPRVGRCARSRDWSLLTTGAQNLNSEKIITG